MEPIILDRIPFKVDLAKLAQTLRLAPGSEPAGMLPALAAAAEALGRPGGLYGMAFIEERGEDFAVIDGVRFQSRVLAVNFALVHRVFPSVVTCGPELDAWAAGFSDGLERYLAEGVKGEGLRLAVEALQADLDRRFEPGSVAMMNPGSLPDWPLPEQRQLFRLLGDTRAAIGVELLESCFMSPNLSVSGIAFPSGEGFQNCSLCPREKCPGRRAPHDRDMFERKYRKG